MSESYYQKAEREAGEELKKLLSRPMASTEHEIGVIDEKTNEPEFFDPWDIFPLLYGSYSSSFDDMAIRVLTDINNGEFNNRDLADEMFREILCRKNLCDYGSSPRVCFPTEQFEEMLPEYIEKWKQYYELMWGEPYEADDAVTDLQLNDPDTTTEAL